MNEPATISVLDAAEFQTHLPELAGLLHACVIAEASVGFVLPFDIAEAEQFWSAKILPSISAGRAVQMVARIDGRIVGAVLLDHDTAPNQPHRAEVRKLLVHPDFRRRGVARSLMHELERRALALSRTLLTLDTRTGDFAEPLYASMGFHTVGMIPTYCRDAADPRKLDATTIMYKALA